MTDTATLNTINLKEGTAEQKRAEILSYYNEALEIEENLYAILADDSAFYKRSDALRHPIIFYYGHTSVFFINKLILAKLIDQRINPELESIFAIGVDEMSWDDLNEQNYQWPTVEETRAFRSQVADMVRNLIKELPLQLPIDWKNPFWPIVMGIEHLRIHIETSSVLIRQLDIDKVQANVFGKRCTLSGVAPQNELIDVAGGRITLGKKANHSLYGWDTEYGEKTENIPPFKASKYLVSNQEFLEFVENGDYSSEKYWTTEGWEWRSYTKAECPLFWTKKSDGYYLRLLDEIIPMPWDWPVEINYLEAKAFCNWKGEHTNTKLRMPTETEWQHMHNIHQVPDIDTWGKAPGNINLEHFSSPCPVNSFQFGEFYDLIGNVWQWTETPISGYAGFKVHPLYDDFSTPTFDGKHNLIKGGSWISTGNEASKHARYAFRRHFYQHAGFRYVESTHTPIIEDDSYETDEKVAISCEDNYGENNLNIENFYPQISNISLQHIKNPESKRVLDINCDTGRLAFELSKNFKHVTALDASARFIKMAISMQEKGNIRYVIKNEGDLVFYQEKQLKDFSVTPETAKKIQFMQADASNLKAIYTGYDMIIATNLLEELHAPEEFLNNIHQRLNANGLLLISSSYEWDTEATKNENWLGGFKKDGEPVYAFDRLSEILSTHFTLVDTPIDVPKVSRLSSRSFNVKQEHISVWKKIKHLSNK